MTRIITKYILRGVLTLLPLILTIYPIYYFFTLTDTLSKRISGQLFPAFDYIPGTGIALGLVALFLLGLLMSSPLARRLYELIELPFKNIPLVKGLYLAIKELTDYLSPEDKKRADKVVLVKMPEQPVELIGFVMREDMDKLPEGITREGRTVVYIPLSYQIGGFTLFLPNEWLTPLDISVEDAMKNTLTGWITTGSWGKSSTPAGTG
jgi:uncharacterized membrane protein